MKRSSVIFLVTLLPAAAWSQATDLATVVSKPVSRTIDLPAELLPFQSVAIHAKIHGYVERIPVDRGSQVHTGDLLVELSAPEMAAQIAEAEARVQAAEADRLQAVAQLAASQSTADRMKKANETPGAVAGNEVVLAEKAVDVAAALVRSREEAGKAAAAAVRTIHDLQSYLKISAPFDGVVTERMEHPGALVGPGNDDPILTLQEVSRLRLVVPVPEEDAGNVVTGASVTFQVPAWPGRIFNGKIARISHALDARTRTMPVELDVFNRDGTLAPGMYPLVKWHVRRSRPSLFVPRTSVVTTTERTFVVRDQNGRAEWVDVRKGTAEGELIEVSGNLAAGDRVVRRANDEIREGTPIPPAKGPS